MKLSHSFCFALKVLLLLPREAEEKPMSCHELSLAGNMPKRFLLLILRNLEEHGFVRICRGASDGYELARDPDEINLANLLDALSTSSGTLIPEGITLPPTANQHIEQVCSQAENASNSVLSKVTLSQLSNVPIG